ncbi:HAD family hydrolase [Anaerosporobacter faecicola]|uniref:HAD family hydrolase n=1 Tax=Anaerosporobacter faecicola TaxID=2718714 RepID=UPI00143A4C74|nr:HAD family phosphatase [Anaerosporobacter faecicola]
MIKNVILDIGNVLMAFCWEKYYHSFGYSDEVFEKLAKATVLSSTWNEFDKGVLTPDELLHEFIKNDPSVEKEIRQVYANINPTVELYSYTLDWIRHLKKTGYKVYILSNFSEKLHEECDKLDFLKEVDGYILSYQVKLIKPDDRIYQLLLERYDLVPEECVFLDDRLVNIEAARKNGIHGIVFTTYEEALQMLAKLGVETR